MLHRIPEPGDTIEYLGDKPYKWTVHHIRDNICYSQEDELSDGKSFIISFNEGINGLVFNSMHRIV